MWVKICHHHPHWPLFTEHATSLILILTFQKVDMSEKINFDDVNSVAREKKRGGGYCCISLIIISGHQ